MITERAFVEAVVWRGSAAFAGCSHAYKYRLALVSEGVCVLRYDNEAGKGDHKHAGDTETALPFTSLDDMLNAFFADVES